MHVKHITPFNILSNMKTIIIILLLTFNLNVLAQEPPCRIGYPYTAMAATEEEFLRDYEISTAVYGIIKSEYSETPYSNISTYKQRATSVLTVFGLGQGDIIALFIKNKKTDKKMALYLKVAHDTGISEKIELDNMAFYEGSFFYDMNDLKEEYDPNSSITKYINPFPLSYIEKHKISSKKINKMLRQQGSKQ